MATERPNISPEQIKNEKAKARELRQSDWWRKIIQQGSECFYCQKHIVGEQITMDHVVPIALGGKSTKDNIVCACLDCNQKKRSQNPVDFLLSK